MDQEKFWILLSKKLNNESSVEETLEYEELIKQYPHWHSAVQNIEDIWRQDDKSDSLEAHAAYLLHMERMKELDLPVGHELQDEIPFIPAHRNNRKRYWIAAAAIILLLAGTYFLFLNKQSKNISITRDVNEISTRPGSKSKVELPDGSIVWLNVGSTLTYKKDFGQGQREVSLSGEGYFDVKKMEDKPFVIHTSKIDIRVLGTVFNVKAYPDDQRTETSLIRGRVEVTIKNRPNDKIILSPNEKLVVENEHEKKSFQNAKGETLTVNKTEIIPNTATIAVNKLKYDEADGTLAETEWINNRLVFRDERLADIIVQMERWYGVKIVAKEEALLNTRLNGSFDNETVTQALDALRESVPFQYEQNKNEISIFR